MAAPGHEPAYRIPLAHRLEFGRRAWRRPATHADRRAGTRRNDPPIAKAEGGAWSNRSGAGPGRIPRGLAAPRWLRSPITR